MLKVKIPFVGNGYNMPDAGALIDPPEDVAEYLVEIGVAEPYETKVQPLPENIKKNEPSALSRPGRARPKRTRKNSKRPAKKS
jgi:hypothetical protein